MLLHDFYTTQNLQYAEGSLQAEISFHASHPIFAGHFPQQPVVPGVCMMQVVKNLLEAAVQQPLQLTAAGNAKFLSMIVPTPGLLVKASIQFSHTAAGIEAQASLTGDTTTYFKLTRAQYQPKEQA